MKTRTPFTHLPIIAALSASLSLAACAGETEAISEEDAAENASIVEDEAPSGDEIAEAVPGVEDADPEGTSPNTMNLGEEENIETVEEGSAGFETDDGRE